MHLELLDGHRALLYKLPQGAQLPGYIRLLKLWLRLWRMKRHFGLFDCCG
ncbi:hypothetical protein [Streptosporangium sp. NPDC051022]